MPFGLTNAPAIFQSLMNFVFCTLLRKFVLVFFDYIMIYSASWLLQLHHLEVVHRILKQHQLSICQIVQVLFSIQKVEYLGHVV